MAMQYIMHFENGDKIHWNLIDNEITRAWIDVIKPRLDMGHDKPIGQHGHWLGCDGVEEATALLKENVKIIKDAGYEITEFETIDRDMLNTLHEEFHALEEPIFLGTADYEPKLDKAIRDVNELVHRIEGMIKTNGNSYWVFQVDTDLNARIPVTDEMRLEHWKFRNTRTSRLLRLGYATIGKNMMHMVNDADPGLWPDKIRPQQNIHTETIIEIATKPIYWADQMNTELSNSIDQFCKDNDIPIPTEPMHRNCIQPLLGEMEEKLTVPELHNLFRNVGMCRVELSGV